MFNSSKKKVPEYSESRKSKHHRHRDESSVKLIDASNDPNAVWMTEDRCMLTARRLGRFAFLLSVVAGILSILELLIGANIPAVAWLVLISFIVLMNVCATGTWSGMISAESSKHQDTYKEYLKQLASNPLYIIDFVAMWMFGVKLILIAFIIGYARKDLSVISHTSSGFGTPYIAFIFTWFLYYVVFSSIISLFCAAIHIWFEVQDTITTRHVKN